MAKRRPRMAVVRPYEPNFAELAIYREVLRDFDITYFYTGPAAAVCRGELDAMGLRDVAIHRYQSHTDLFPTSRIANALGLKLGFGSWMFSGLRHALSHDLINVVDPIYRFPVQLVHQMRPDQKLIVVRWEVIPNRYDDVIRGQARSAQVLDRADGIVCTTAAARDSLTLRMTKAPRIAVIHPGIMLPMEFSALPSDPEPRIVTVGRLQWQKGIDDLLAAVALLHRLHSIPARLTVIGGGDVRSWRRVAVSYGLRNEVEFLGAIPNNLVRQRIAQATVYCQPSVVSRTWCEQFGFAVVEAMASARPVVTTSTGVLPEIVGPDGIYAAARNAASLAAALAGVFKDLGAAAQRGNRLAALARDRYNATRQGIVLRDFLNAL